MGLEFEFLNLHIEGPIFVFKCITLYKLTNFDELLG